MPRRVRLLDLLLLLIASSLARPAHAEDPPGTIVVREGLALPAAAGPRGGGGRVPVAADPIGAQIAAGTFSPPRAGDTVEQADRPTRTWVAVTAGADGAFPGPALAGGPLFVNVPSDRDRVMLLDASGHAGVFVGGAYRMGDPYGHGYLRIPVALRPGDNPMLLLGGRGAVRARLLPFEGPARLDTADVTLPDLIAGQAVDTWGAVVVQNGTEATLDGLTLAAEVAGAPAVSTPVPPIPPLGVRKVAFRLVADASTTPGPRPLALTLGRADAPAALGTASLTLAVVAPDQTHRRTFRSGIDGSVQYFGLVPAATDPKDPRKPGVILSLHGASVEGIGQAQAYGRKAFAHVVAPTNRRPYGFDWEDWGRLDAIEVLELAQAQLDADARRAWLTGHSMGGHGTWHLGVTFPDRFAAIAPSAGWVSMFSYAGARRPDAAADDPIAPVLQRATNPSDTLALAENLQSVGVYILHGDADDNVPVDQARTMRAKLGAFHPDFGYYERPGAGHWWGNECVDWPALIAFLQARERPALKDVQRVAFTTMNPGISARSHWASIEAQQQRLAASSVTLDADPAKRSITGTTANVARLALDLSPLEPGGPATVTLDGQTLTDLPEPAAGVRAWFERAGADGAWARVERPSPALKGPHRAGPFKDAFRNRFLLVYGTTGTPEENAWALAKARYDAEQFYYRGNGSVDVVPDTGFDPKTEPDRGVILYGNADTNAAWPALLADSPVQVHRDALSIGDRTVTGPGHAALFLRPRPGSDVACVAVIGGTGLPGARITDRLPVFVSGVAYPDLTVFGPETLRLGAAGIEAAGNFGNDWGLASGDITWRSSP